MTGDEYVKFAAEWVFDGPQARIPDPYDKDVQFEHPAPENNQHAKAWAAWWGANARRGHEFFGTPIPVEFLPAPRPL